MIGLVLLGLLLVLFAWPLIAERTRKPMTPELRRAAGGSFAELSQGVTHYHWIGPLRGPVAVCIHGLTTPAVVWSGLARGLAAWGFRVLVYDLYGRGCSDRPPGLQDRAFFLRQLEELLEFEGVRRDITLFGYSMGGAIATAWTARHPDLARDLILLAPAGLGHDLGPVARLVANHNWVGRWLMHLTYARSFRASVEAERDIETSQIPNVVPLQLNELRYRGFIPAVTSSLHHMLDHDLTEAHRKIAEAGTPLLAIWAAEDEVIPVAGAERLAALNPGARNVIIPEAGHALAYTHSPAVTAALDAAELRR